MGQGQFRKGWRELDVENCARMMVRRLPDEKSRAPPRDPYGNTPRLKDTLDLGFPYDDGDNSIND